jgi:hypothetical protein
MGQSADCACAGLTKNALVPKSEITQISSSRPIMVDKDLWAIVRGTFIFLLLKRQREAAPSFEFLPGVRLAPGAGDRMPRIPFC